MIWRWDRAHGLLVADPFGIHQRFVQIQERGAKLLQPLLGGGCHNAAKCAALRPRPQMVS